MNTAYPHPILSLKHVSIRERASGRALVEDVSFQLHPGQCLGIVGESGSGKTLLCRAIMGLLPPALMAEGEAVFDGTDMLHTSEETARRLRGTGISAVLQQAMTAFDPLYTIGAQLQEILREKCVLSRAQARNQAEMALNSVNLPPTVLKKYPHQLSGGMLQRCMIAICLALGSRLVVADEPTTALDAHNQREVLQRFAQMREQYGTTLILVSHDLGAVQLLADRLLVMQGGRCVEQGAAATVFDRPQHEHTRYLVRTRLALTRAFERILEDSHATA